MKGDIAALADTTLEEFDIKTGTTYYTYNELNQLVSESNDSKTTTYTYDDNGNLVKVQGEKTKDYTYDSENHLLIAMVQQGNAVTVEEYTYDYAGNRTSKVVNEVDVTKYINDVNSSLTYVLGETDKDGKLKKSYTRGQELISAESKQKTAGSAADIHYFLYDGHGSTCLLTDKDGNVTDRYSYDGYGNLIEKEGDTENDFLYTGEQYNYITELYYLRARYMDPSTGTFISMDSYAGTLYDPVSLHKYLYANANPVMNTDPSGYFSLSECIVTVGQKISMVNQKIHEIKTLQKMMNTANALCTVYDMLTMMKEVWLGERSIVDVALVLLRGIAIGYLINCACGTQLGVVLKPVLGALGVKSNVDELVEAINNRDVVEIIVRSVQLVCAIFGLTAQCFTGDTLISTENGLVPIEDIKVGDLVWTENIETGEQELKEVTKVYVNKTDKILHLTIEKEGDIETIDTTEGHPFYVEGKGWVRAGALQKGDVLTSETGNTVVVSKQTENLSVPVIIYNLEVADNHTYFVSEEKVLVHNSGNSGCSVETSTDAEGESKTIRYQDYDEISQRSIHNPGKAKAMLGKYDGGGPTSYITRAGDDFTYFSLGDDWNIIKETYGLSDMDMFNLFNVSYLDDGINAGKSFYFSHNPVGDSGFLGMEFAYLKSNNYIWDSETMTMRPY